MCGVNARNLVNWYYCRHHAPSLACQARPGTRRLPLGMNPASWMLDILEGRDSSNGLSGVESSNSFLEGSTLQREYFASELWVTQSRAMEAKCTPASGATALLFPSTYARSRLFQVRCMF